MNYWWGILLFIVLIIFIRTKKRGYFWKIRKTREQLTLKQFFKKWGKGIEGITPLQQARSKVMGFWITLVGILAGIVINLIIRVPNQWIWLTIVLTGSLVISSVSQIGNLQSLWRLKLIDEAVKEIQKNIEMEVENVR